MKVDMDGISSFGPVQITGSTPAKKAKNFQELLAKAGATQGKDSVKLTEEAQNLSKAVNVAEVTQTGRQERITFLHTLVASGSYQVDPEELAKKLASVFL